MVDGYGGKGCRRSGDGGEWFSFGRRNFFRPTNNTLSGQERGREERPRTEDCCVLETRNNRRSVIVALLFHALYHGELERLMAWWWDLFRDSELDSEKDPAAGRVLWWGVFWVLFRELMRVSAGLVDRENSLKVGIRDTSGWRVRESYPRL